MNSIETRAVVQLVAVCMAVYAVGCSGSADSLNFSDAAAESTSGDSSGSNGGSGSGGSSGSNGASGSSSGSPGSGGGSGSGGGRSGSGGGSGSSGGSAGSSSSGARDAGGGPGICTTKTDCRTGELCGFPESARCSATGTCFPAPGVTCNAIVLACACDGTDFNIACDGLPSGYMPKPFAHTGACGLDAGGGSSDSGSEGGRDAGSFACGPYSCDVATEFCYEAGGGAVLPDGGSNFTYACNPIPTQCEPDPTCTCVMAADAGTHGCPCRVQPGGALVAACLYPGKMP
jgi:hypothetical protein